ncbi:MAG: thiamine-phosphate kinase [Planctomycetota bacterium]
MTKQRNKRRRPDLRLPKEDAFYRWLAEFPVPRGDVLVGVGDDAACLRFSGENLLMTTDQVMDGVHFDATRDSPILIGRKAMARSLSDIAAMGGTPTHAVVTMALPRGTKRWFLEQLYYGMDRIARRFQTAIVGGDTGSWRGRLLLTTTVIGTHEGRTPVLRSGAAPGDVLLVTGPLGGSRLGHHLTFMPRVREARTLLRSYTIHAMMDISDGLLLDLARMLAPARLGAVLREADIPVSADAARAARRSGRSALTHALTDGEDYEILLALPPREAGRLLRRPPYRPAPVAIGIVSEGEFSLLKPNGRKTPLSPRGYRHDF